VLRKYQPEDVYYPPGVDVNLRLYGSTNFIWNPTCCQSAGLKEISADDIYSMILAYRTIQFLLIIAIALIFSHVFISGMLLNFLLLMPFLKA
jgi:hypothetical protein